MGAAATRTGESGFARCARNDNQKNKGKTKKKQISGGDERKKSERDMTAGTARASANARPLGAAGAHT
jgi:hypothetical protein